MLLLKRSDTSVEFFDPYGMRPDAELKFIPRPYREKTGQWGRLVELIEADNCPYTVYYNQQALQSDDPKIGTCGRWCALRARLSNFTLDDFQKMFLHQQQAPDWLVTAITLLI